ncbi:MAG: hypothetical protein M1828_006447 [Chrysothrix sp. TS-e1954]|nr:MAG: hypothetical protein M1828_006447 [Chrysothrix sp. TS-e1954]
MSDANYDIAITQLVIYLPLIPLALFILFKYRVLGVEAFAGWLFLIAYSTLQIVSGALSISSGKQHTSTTGIILTQIGLGPLMLATMGLLHLINSFTSLRDSIIFRPLGQLIFHVVSIGATVILAVGSSSLYSTDPSSKATTEVKIGAVVYAIIWIFLVIVLINSFLSRTRHGVLSKLLWTTAFALSMILLRLIYTLLSVFDTSSTAFNPITGSTAAQILLEVIPLALAAIVWIIAGIASMGELPKAKAVKGQSRILPTRNARNKAQYPIESQV